MNKMMCFCNDCSRDYDVRGSRGAGTEDPQVALSLYQSVILVGSRSVGSAEAPRLFWGACVGFLLSSPYLVALPLDYQ